LACWQEQIGLPVSTKFQSKSRRLQAVGMAGLRDLLCVLIGIGRWFTGWNFAFTQIAVYTDTKKLSIKALVFAKTGY